MDVGIALPSNRTAISKSSLIEILERVEVAGASSVWLNDHLAALPAGSDHYPYAVDGRIDWDPHLPQYEALTLCAFSAARTSMRLGTAVLILPQRHPIEVAKMSATLAALSDRPFMLGVGAGWSRREMALLGWDPRTRGARLDEEIMLIRSIWDGEPRPQLQHYPVPPDFIFSPRVPSGRCPLILVGGISDAALQRAARLGDGWIAVSDGSAGSVTHHSARLNRLRRDASARDLHCVLKVGLPTPDAAHAASVTELAAGAGWDELCFEFGTWDLPAVCATLRAVCHLPLVGAPR
jgi:alkanesulfonate monooxygenase SsuD/methylene tetrahydromethanopterin reductase-like flavin-dependent oxidoreductase (luciferase family)